MGARHSNQTFADGDQTRCDCCALDSGLLTLPWKLNILVLEKASFSSNGFEDVALFESRSSSVQLKQISSHIPMSLIHQIGTEWLTNWRFLLNTHSDPKVLTFRPSVQRFRGALLFIDISGFTALSARTNPDG